MKNQSNFAAHEITIKNYFELTWIIIKWSPSLTLRFKGDFPLKKSFTWLSFNDSRACITVFSAFPGWIRSKEEKCSVHKTENMFIIISIWCDFVSLKIWQIRVKLLLLPVLSDANNFKWLFNLILNSKNPIFLWTSFVNGPKNGR